MSSGILNADGSVKTTKTSTLKNEMIEGELEKGYIFHTGSKGSKLIVSGSDADIIHVDNFSNTEVMINDNSAFQSDRFNREFTEDIPNELYNYTLNDELHINNSKKGEGAFIFFDVATNDANPPRDYTPNLYITKNANIMSFMSPKYTPGFVAIENWFEGRVGVETNGESDGNGKIEHIYYNNGKIEAIEDYISRVSNDVKTCLNTLNSTLPSNKKFKSAMEVLERGSKSQKQAIINCYTKENAQIFLLSHSEGGKIAFYGSTGNDVINVNDNYVVNAGKGNDKVLRYDYKDAEENRVYAKNYTLNGEDGNDVLEAGMNTTINGGKGDNAIIVNANSDVTITQGKGKDYIHLTADQIEGFEFTKDGNTLIMEAEGGAKITLKDYFKYGNKSSIKGIADSGTSYEKTNYANNIVANVKNASANNTIGNILLNSELDIVPIVSKNTINGTAYNDNIDASELTLKKTVGKGKNKQTINRVATDSGLTINGGNGNDEIYGTQYSDTIKGGSGYNELFGEAGNDKIYAGNGLENLIEGNTGNDKIYCEKGNSEIRFSTGDGDDIVYTGKGRDSIEFDTDINALTYGVYKNDLIINHGDGDSVRIANYFKAKGNTSIKTVNGENFINQMETAEIIINGQATNKNKITGTYLTDIITGGNYNDTINGANGNDEIHGGAGNDVIYGGNYDDSLYGDVGNDTIKGGNGWDEIYGGTGNDKLYGEGGENGFHFYTGDAKDTIYMGKGVDNIYLDDTTQEKAPTYERSGNHLVIKYGNKDSITVSNYFKSKNPSVKSVNYDGITDDLSGKLTSSKEDDIIIKGELDRDEYWGNFYYYGGNEKNNLIYTASNFDEIDTGEGNNTVYINTKKEALVRGGSGDDVYHVNSLKKFVYLNDADGKDKLVINEKASNINVLFDVVSQDNLLSPSYSSMLVLNDSNYNKLKKTLDFDTVNINSCIEVARDGDLGVEYIYSKDNKMIDVAQLQETVANWLTDGDRNYASAMSVLESGNKNDINALLQVYQNAWEKAV